MHWLFDALVLSLQALAVVCGVYWLAVAAAATHTRLALPTLRAGLRLPPSGQRVCIIVPAHNEAASIGSLVRSLRSQDHRAWSAVIALDRCTDGTELAAMDAIEGDSRITLMAVEQCPSDWAGKVNAAWQAVRGTAAASEADTLLFIDADTRMHPGCVRAAVALLEQRGDDLLSVLSTLDVVGRHEWVAQVPAGFELARWYPPVRASRRHRRRPFANGQFMLFRREAYDRIGGHEAVKDDLLEDMAFARRIYEHGLSAAVLLADGVHRCRMYDDWSAFERGWKRIYTECANRKVSRLRGTARRLVLTSAVLPLAAILCSVASPAIGLPALAAGLFGVAVVTRSSGAPLLTVLTYPIGALVVARIMRSAADDLVRGVPTTWAGRTYTREAR